MGTETGMDKVATLVYVKCTYCVLLFKTEMPLVHDKHESHFMMFVSPPLLVSLQERGAKSFNSCNVTF